MTDDLVGVVKSFDIKKGFGFIMHKNDDYFVHYKNIDTPGFKQLFKGQKVLFSAVRTDKGLKAVGVTIA